MSINFENELRDDLQRSTTPDLDIDVDEVIGRGQRAVTRRTMLRGGIGLGVLAFGGLAAGIVSDRLPLQLSPAKQPPPADWVTVDLDRLANTAGRYDTSEPKLFRVEVNRATLGAGKELEDANFRTRVSDANGIFGEGWAGGDAPITGATWGTGSGMGGYVVGLMAGSPEHWTMPGAAAHTLESRPVPGTNLTAFLMRFDDPNATESLTEIYWLEKDGKVRNTFGAVLHTVAFARPDAPRALSVFIDPEQKQWGLVDGQRMVAQPITGEVPLPIASDDATSRLRVVLLPADVSATELVSAAGWSSLDVDATTHTVCLVWGPASGPMATLNWTAADGTTNSMQL